MNPSSATLDRTRVEQLVRTTLATTTPGKTLKLVVLKAGATAPTTCEPSLACATLTTAGSTYTADANGNAVVHFKTDAAGKQYFWLIVDGATATDVADYALEITGC